MVCVLTSSTSTSRASATMGYVCWYSAWYTESSVLGIYWGGGGGGGVLDKCRKKWVSIVCKNYPEGNLYTGLHEVLIREDATLEPLEDEYWLFYCTHRVIKVLLSFPLCPGFTSARTPEKRISLFNEPNFAIRFV